MTAADAPATESTPAPASPPPAADDPASSLTRVTATRRPKALRPPQGDEAKLGWFSRFVQRTEKKFSELSTRSNFWHRTLAWVFLPLAYRSGIRLGEHDADGFAVVLPFRRFNRNWYSAMAGAALLANSEVAGGMYIFGFVGADYTVVCKELSYKFLRPCLGPAIYRVKPVDDVEALMADGDEFNVRVEMEILQAVVHKDEKERRVGRCEATFHVAPKSRFRERKAKQRERRKRG